MYPIVMNSPQPREEEKYKETTYKAFENSSFKSCE